MHKSLGLRLAVLLCAMAFLPACSLLAGTDKGDLAKPDGGLATDSGTDSGPIPCPTDCDDGNVCTADACSDLGTCTHASTCSDEQICDATEGCVTRTCTSNDECDNGLACDGEETCDPDATGANAATGCVDGTVLDCNDDVSCTVDSCEEGANGCVNAAEDNLCSDGVDCTTDLCDPGNGGADSDGCVRTADNALCRSTCYPNATCNVGAGHCDYGTPLSCGDSNDECSVNTCDPVEDMCVSSPVDVDMDGHKPDGCSGGGDDCDDNDPSVYPGADEVCGNGKDDDCDDSTDEDGCTTVPDKCSSAIAIEIQGDGPATVTTTLALLHADGTTACDDGASAGKDAVYYVDVPSSRDLEVSTEGSDVDTIVAVQDSNNTCSDSAWSFACNDDFAATTTASRVWAQGSFFGVHRVFILVKARGGNDGDEIKLTVRLRTLAVLSCGSPAITDISTGGTYVGAAPALGLTRGTCQGGGMMNRGTEAVAMFKPTASGSATVGAVAMFKPFVYVRSSNCLMGSEVACMEGTSVGGGLNIGLVNPTLTAGTTYYAFVDGARSGNRFALTYVAP